MKVGAFEGHSLNSGIANQVYFHKANGLDSDMAMMEQQAYQLASYGVRILLLH